MLFIFSTPVLIRHLWQLKTVVFLHWCLKDASDEESLEDSVLSTLGGGGQQNLKFLGGSPIQVFYRSNAA